MEKEKSIETAQLLIKGNIISCDGMLIQLCNISCISTIALEQLAFPALSIVILLFGLFMLTQKVIVGILLLMIGAAWIYGWYYINNQRKLKKILNIVMNSGNSLQFIFTNQSFLVKVLHVLEQIIINGGVGKQNVVINVHGNTITGNANMLNDLKL